MQSKKIQASQWLFQYLPGTRNYPELPGTAWLRVGLSRLRMCPDLCTSQAPIHKRGGFFCHVLHTFFAFRSTLMFFNVLCVFPFSILSIHVHTASGVPTHALVTNHHSLSTAFICSAGNPSRPSPAECWNWKVQQLLQEVRKERRANPESVTSLAMLCNFRETRPSIYKFYRAVILYSVYRSSIMKAPSFSCTQVLA